MSKLTAEKLGEEKAKLYNPDGLSLFPFEKVTDDCRDVRIFYSDKISEKVSGAIAYDKGLNTFMILINSKEQKTRQNFTTAHELGHYFLHSDTIKENEMIVDGENTLDGSTFLYRQTVPYSTEVEVEANNFAAALLMPSDLVEKAWMSLKNVEECAKIFTVSITAMSIRLERLGLVG